MLWVQLLLALVSLLSLGVSIVAIAISYVSASETFTHRRVDHQQTARDHFEDLPVTFDNTESFVSKAVVTSDTEPREEVRIRSWPWNSFGDATELWFRFDEDEYDDVERYLKSEVADEIDDIYYHRPVAILRFETVDVDEVRDALATIDPDFGQYEDAERED